MAELDARELDRMLTAAFEASTKIYQERGFQRRIGFGRKPALVSVDLANAWTRPGNPFTCDQEAMDGAIIPGMQRLLEACRRHGHPVIHVTTAYEITDREAAFTDMGLWHCKIPVEAVNLKDRDLWAIDSRIAPVEGEYTLLKKRASSFHGTELAGILQPTASTRSS
jgi:Amidases related to nicotinamidase